jgi:putative ABC transport system permease protein
MNLALKDIRYNLVKFLSSTVGLGLILMVVLTIAGIIRGIILDSATIIQATGADLWVVQKDILGPFVESSRLPKDYYHAIQAVDGVEDASPLAMAWEHVVRPMRPSPLTKFMYINALITTRNMVEPGWMNMPMEDRFIVVGYEPGHIGGPPSLVAGRNIEASRYEMVADVQTGFRIGERVRIGNYDYTVVGLTKNIVGYTADPVIYVSLDDAQEIIFELDPDLLRNQPARLRRQITGSGNQVPARNYIAEQGAQTAVHAARAMTLPPTAEIMVRDRAAAVAEDIRTVNAIAVKVRPGYSPEQVAQEIARWKHLQAFTSARQVNLQLMGSNRLILLQLSVFRLILLLISGIIIGFVIYTFTLSKTKEIALLKLLGAKRHRIYGMILQEAIAMGIIATVLGAVFELSVQDYFPRRVVVTYDDIIELLIAIILVAVAASLFAIRRAMKVEARSVLSA